MAYHVFDLQETWTSAGLMVVVEADDDRVRLHAHSGSGSVLVQATAEQARQIADALVDAASDLGVREPESGAA